jgi:hypothetical protein
LFLEGRNLPQRYREKPRETAFTAEAQRTQRKAKDLTQSAQIKTENTEKAGEILRPA